MAKDRSSYPTRRRPQTRLLDRPQILLEAPRRRPVDVVARVRWSYAAALCNDPSATLDDVREAVTMLEDLARIARRVFGDAHPFTGKLESVLRDARAVLSAREGGDVSAVRAALDAMKAT